MMTSRGLTGSGLVLAAVVLLSVGVAVPALAAEPVKITQVVLDYDTLDEFCGFLLEDHQDVKVTEWYEFDAEGNEAGYRAFIRYLTHTITNPANGRSLSLEGGLYNLFAPVDGPLVFTGSIGHFTVPGEGIVFHDAGRVEVSPESVDVTGGFHDFFLGRFIGASHPEAVCDYLAG